MPARFITLPVLEPRPQTDMVWTRVSIPVANIKEIRVAAPGTSAPWDKVEARITMKDEMTYYTRLSVDEVTERVNA